MNSGRAADAIQSGERVVAGGIFDGAAIRLECGADGDAIGVIIPGHDRITEEQRQ